MCLWYAPLSSSILSPWDMSLLGKSTHECAQVSSFDELTAHADKAKGKVVLFNVPFTTYGETVAYRTRGADAASAVRLPRGILIILLALLITSTWKCR